MEFEPTEVFFHVNTTQYCSRKDLFCKSEIRSLAKCWTPTLQSAKAMAAPRKAAVPVHLCICVLSAQYEEEYSKLQSADMVQEVRMETRTQSFSFLE